MLLAACSSLSNSLEPRANARSATIAIESIDGPPQTVTRKLAADLNKEAAARNLVIVPREETAQYRLRGYLSPHVEHGKTTITWVWDVYGSDQRRVLRITGDEPSVNHARDAWAAVDERVLRKIAQTGMDRILAYVNSPESSELSIFPMTVQPAASTSANLAGPPS